MTWIVAIAALTAAGCLFAAFTNAGVAEWAKGEADNTSGPARTSYRAIAERANRHRDRWAFAALTAAVVLGAVLEVVR